VVGLRSPLRDSSPPPRLPGQAAREGRRVASAGGGHLGRGQRLATCLTEWPETPTTEGVLLRGHVVFSCSYTWPSKWFDSPAHKDGESGNCRLCSKYVSTSLARDYTIGEIQHCEIRDSEQSRRKPRPVKWNRRSDHFLSPRPSSGASSGPLVVERLRGLFNQNRSSDLFEEGKKAGSCDPASVGNVAASRTRFPNRSTLWVW
jgi:hypothetical protein